MARRSVLSVIREGGAQVQPEPEIPPPASPEVPRAVAPVMRPSRVAKLHVGGYFDPADPTVMAFQKLKVDLRRSQQDMLMEALADFVAKHTAAQAFR